MSENDEIKGIASWESMREGLETELDLSLHAPVGQLIKSFTACFRYNNLFQSSSFEDNKSRGKFPQFK